MQSHFGQIDAAPIGGQWAVSATLKKHIRRAIPSSGLIPKEMLHQHILLKEEQKSYSTQFIQLSQATLSSCLCSTIRTFIGLWSLCWP